MVSSAGTWLEFGRRSLADLVQALSLNFLHVIHCHYDIQRCRDVIHITKMVSPAVVVLTTVEYDIFVLDEDRIKVWTGANV